MKIDYSKLEMVSWFEDENGNFIQSNSESIAQENPVIKDADVVFYKACNPAVYRETVDEYCYHAKNPLIVFLMLISKRFKRYMLHKNRHNKTFRPAFSMNTGFGSKISQECIVAMVNSGDYTLSQAIFVYCNACERCSNALIYKYLDGKDGYPEYSEEWKKTNTCCDWCKGDSV